MSFAEFMNKVLGSQPSVEAAAAAQKLPMQQLTSSSGWEREKALKTLTRAPQAAALPLLLVRVNDWVPQVRAAAREAVRALLRPADAAAWAQALPEVVALTRAGRADHAELLNEIDSFLSSPAVLPALQAAVLPDTPLTVRRHVRRLEWQAASNAADRMAWLHAALVGRDIPLAHWALSSVSSLAEAADRARLWAAAMTSPFSRIRLSALACLRKDAPEGLPSELLQDLALSAHAALRRSAWAMLPAAQQAQVKARAMARVVDASVSARHRVAALGLLAETDFECVRPLCQAWGAEPLPSVRVALLAALRAHADDAQVEALVWAAWADSAPRLQQYAARQVQQGVYLADSVRVLEQAFQHQTALALRRAREILRHGEPWAVLLLWLQAMGLSLEADREAEVADAVACWQRDMQHICMPPKPVQAQAIKAAWLQVVARLPRSLQSSLGFVLATAGVLD